MTKRKKNRNTLKGAQVWVDDARPSPSAMAIQHLKGSGVFPAGLAEHVSNFGPKTVNNLMQKHKTMGKLHMLLVSNNKKAFAGVVGFGPVAYYDLYQLIPDYFEHVRNGGDPFKFAPRAYPPNPWSGRADTPERKAKYDVEKKSFYPYKSSGRGKAKAVPIIDAEVPTYLKSPPPVVVDLTTSLPPESIKVGVSDGSTASYYELPDKATELQHLIMYKDMNSQMGEIFRSCYRYGEASHSGKLRDAKKIKFYIDAEIERLEKWT
mgnify:CR=1 FL=1